MRKQNKSMLVLAVFTVFIALGLFFTGMTRTVDAAPPCNVCEELGTIEGELSTLDEGVGAIDMDLEAIETELASAAEKLDKIPPTWSQVLPASERFELVMDGAAVLDKETGLVWEQSPGITTKPWSLACSYCTCKEVGGRLGWRLPTIEELASLVDRSVTGSTKLPSGYEAFFSNVQPHHYWSSTTPAGSADVAWVVFLELGEVNIDAKNNFSNYVWCVRGGQGNDAY